MVLFDNVYVVLSTIIIIAVTYLGAKSVGYMIKSVTRFDVPIVTIHIARFASLLIWTLGVLLALETIGIRIDILLVMLGLGGLAAILSFKEVMQNFVAKYFSDIYLPFKIEDEITVLGHTGKVIGINPICTILLDKDEKIISIPNSTFIKEPVVNVTTAAWKEIIIPIMVPASIDFAEFEADVLKASNKLKMYWDENFPPRLNVKERHDNSMRVELTLMVDSPKKKETASAEMNKRIMEILAKAKRGH